MEKACKLAAQDEDWPPPIDSRKSGFQPVLHRAFMYCEQLRGLVHRVAAMDFDAPRVVPLQPVEPVSMSARTSSARHAVIRGPSFTGFGYRPDLTPAHQVDLLTGIGPPGPMMDAKRIKPDFGRLASSTSS